MYQLTRRIFGVVATGIMVVAATLAVQTPAFASVTNKPTDDGPRVLSCSHPHPDVDQRSYANLFDASNVNMRPGPHTNCTPVLGLGQLNHNVDYHCYVVGTTVNGYTTWTYLRNVTTGISGWVSDSLLDLNSNGTRGSLVHC